MTGRLWPFYDRNGETGPVTRLWRKTGEQHRQSHGLATLTLCLVNEDAR